MIGRSLAGLIVPQMDIIASPRATAFLELNFSVHTHINRISEVDNDETASCNSAY
jgi:hypothetical protein